MNLKPSLGSSLLITLKNSLASAITLLFSGNWEQQNSNWEQVSINWEDWGD